MADELEDGIGGTSKIYFLDTNLSSPVLITEIQATKNIIDRECVYLASRDKYYEETSRHHQRQDTEFRKIRRYNEWTACQLKTFTRLDPTDYPTIEQGFLQIDHSQYHSDYSIAKQLSVEFEEALIGGLRARGLPEEEVKGTADCLESEIGTPYRHAYEMFSDLFGRAENRVKTNPNRWTHGRVGGIDIWINSSNALIATDCRKYYSSLNQILMLKDKLATRFMLLEHVNPLGLPKELNTHLIDLFKWQDDTLSIYGNQAYNILKAVEPMYKTRLSHVVDNIFGDDTAYTRMKRKIEEKENSIRVATKIAGVNQTGELMKLVERAQEVRTIVEMFGCLKSCGHPLIDPELGGLSAAEEARSPDSTDIRDSQTLRNTFCHIILCSYVQQHGVWPKLIHHKTGTILNLLNQRQERSISYNSYPLDDWTTTEWTKILEFDYFPNFLELMDDKAISLYRSDKHLSWDQGKTPRSNRRLLLEVLTKKNINIKELIERVSRRDVPFDWFIVSLYPKEREFKLEPRMFAMLVLEMRCFFTAVEANIAHSLFRYMPQQTMTKTKTQNQERFLAFTDPKRQSDDYTLFLEIDLTRWNLKWRQCVIHMVGHDLNKMFGTPGVFTVTHWFFSKAQIVVRVAGLRPEGIELVNPPTTSLAWTNHKGGFEGLNQKLWTAATYAMVEMSLVPLLKSQRITGYEVIGQADNQVVRVSIPPNGQTRESIIPEIRDEINHAFETTCKKVNQVVKPEENIESTAVLTYSKDVLVSGVEYPTSLKKHSRLFPVTSLDFPSVTNNARAILAGSVSGAENALYPLRSAIVGFYHAARYLRSATRGYSIHGKAYPKLSDRDIIAAILLPSSIGGLCGLNIASFFYKGGSDPLGKEISGLRFLSEGSSRPARICSFALRALEDRYHMSVDPSLETLIDNPYGLPLASAVSPLSRVGHMTLTAFRGRVKNEDIKPLLTDNITVAESNLKADLLQMRPLNPILAHDLFDASGFGTIKLMRKTFIHTRTVQGVAQSSNPDITHTFLRADLNAVLSFISWFRGIPEVLYSRKSSYDLVKRFRSYWGIELHGVTSYQPLDFIHLVNSTRSSSSVKWSSHAGLNLLTTRGPLSGYVGSATREKRSEHGYKIVDTGAPSRSLTKLQLIRSQAYGNKNFNDFLDAIGLTRSPVKLSEVTDLLPKTIGGSICHRYSSTIRMMSASYVGPLNFVTHIRLDTDTLGEISGSVLNYPIMLQEFLIMTQAAAKLNYIHRQAHSGEMIFDVRDLKPLPDDSLEMPEFKFTPVSLPKSVLLYSQDIRLVRTYDKVAQSVPRRCVALPQEYSSLSSLSEALCGFFIVTLRDQNRAKTIADTRGLTAIPARYQLDVAEAHALGPVAVLIAIAKAVVLTSLRDTFRTLQTHPERWDESLFLVQNIDICLRAVSSYWNHPLFASHADSERFAASSLRYSNFRGKYGRLSAFVRRSISMMMTQYTHSFWSDPIPVFSGENPTQIVEALSILGARAVTRLRLAEDENFITFASLYSGYMRLPRSVHMSSSDALETVRVRLLKLSTIFKKKGDALLSREFENLSQLIGLRVYNDDIRTVLRNARSLTPTLIKKPTHHLERALVKFSPASDHCIHCTPSPLTSLDEMWNQYRVRLHGGLASGGYTWLPIIPVLHLKNTVLIVGNGHGGLADLLISTYSVNVIGLDLEQDMPRDVATLLNYLPMGISQHNRSNFLQSDWSINSSGDWSDPIIRSGVMNELPQLSTVIVDAVAIPHECFKELILSMWNHSKVHNIYFRLSGDANEIWEMVGASSKLGQTTTWVVSNSFSSMELIGHLSRLASEIHKCVSAPKLIGLTHTPEMHDLIPSRYNQLLEYATENSMSWDGETIHQAYQVMYNACSSLLNKPESIQLKYKERIALLLGYATLYACIQPDPRSQIQEWIADDRIETDIFVYNMNGLALHHLMRYVPRLSNIVFNSPLYMSTD